MTETARGQYVFVRFSALIASCKRVLRAKNDPLYDIVSRVDERNLKDCVKLTFTGDLILLREVSSFK